MRSQKLLKLGKLSGAILLAILTASCATTGSSVGTTSGLLFCDGAKAIYWSGRDTADTVAQVKEHNAVGRVACGWK